MISNEIQFTAEQQKVISSGRAFLASQNEEFFTIKGIAGTGKTTCMWEIIKDSVNVIGVTIAHSAKDVLFKALHERFPCYTFAKAVGYTKVVSSTGEAKFVPRESNFDYTPPLASARIIVVDETSMIGKKELAIIKKYKQSGAKVIFMGDPYQLPPVEDEDDSPTFNYTRAELLTPMRYGGIIAELGDAAREQIDLMNMDRKGTIYFINSWIYSKFGREEFYSHGTRFSQYSNEENSGVVFLSDYDQMTNLASKLFREHYVDPNFVRVLCYRNDVIDMLNYELRLNIHREYVTYDESTDTQILPQFVPNELIIANDSYGPNSEINNGSLFKVLEVEPYIHPDYNINCLILRLGDAETGELIDYRFNIIVVDDILGYADYKAMLYSLKAQAKANPSLTLKVTKFEETFAKFNYSYCLTCYKAQGKTYQNVFVIEEDIAKVSKISLKQKIQALNVSCTRAKKTLFVYNKSHKVSHTLLPENILADYELIE